MIRVSHGHGCRSRDWDLKRRVGELEGSFGFLTEQVKGVHKDLLNVSGADRGSFRESRQAVRPLENKIDGVDRKIDTKIDGLARAMPSIVGDAVRPDPVLRESDFKRREAL